MYRNFYEQNSGQNGYHHQSYHYSHYQIGDVVSLKSENKKMTVAYHSQNVDGTGNYLIGCCWLDKNDQCQWAEFSYFMLDKITN
ncbi:DUF2158 domain-containing protein [Xenorhabdus griffiniae]|uniref:DUF2158 domain-containing protein n=1 Tax=Xenorhabdus griffiniae TaxID=351672 RepID=UPI001676D5CB|nr:DUF2158 domain-containing protein [Xenorhabdus griffiniae]MBE8588718.1 DUF2158 domain-containing protein [Xenorhabdus griffiniae]